MTNAEVLSTIDKYLVLYPSEREDLSLLVSQLERDETMNNRSNFNGHVTASAIVLSPDKTEVLLIHHRAFDRWQQPGGHWDPDEDSPLEAAEREAIEETGVDINMYIPADEKFPLVPLSINSHYIPPSQSKGEPEHYHHDFRYVFLATSTKLAHQEAEVDAAEWFAFDTPEAAFVKTEIDRLKLN